MALALVALGSNLGDRRQWLKLAVEQLRELAHCDVVAVSEWHESAPVGGPEGQSAYLNGCALVQTALEPEVLLLELQRIENDLGRTRQLVWGPRTIDLDLLLYDDIQYSSPTLTIPHPRMAWRRFVIEPAAEIAPSLRHPVIGWTMAQLRDHPLHSPPVLSTAAAIRAALAPARQAGQRIGLVPTMGALHAGHISLVQASQAQCDVTVVWIYVNPSQFGPRDDLSKYPRTLELDLAQLAACRGADKNSANKQLFVFAPTDLEVYKPQHGTWVEPLGVAEPLEGKFRPGHFRGVATVVLKMFNMVGPQRAFFGQKDFQQVRVIEQMVADLDLDVEIIACPIVREQDGLAMSSRNIYLSMKARVQALSLSRSLELARRLVREGEKSAATIVARMTDLLQAAGEVQIDYVALVDPQTLQNIDAVTGPTLAAIAVRIAGTRLIDNCILEP